MYILIWSDDHSSWRGGVVPGSLFMFHKYHLNNVLAVGLWMCSVLEHWLSKGNTLVQLPALTKKRSGSLEKAVLTGEII